MSRVEHKRAEVKAFLRHAMADAGGKAFITAFLESFDPFMSTHHGGDPTQSAHAEGRRAAGVFLYTALFEASPEDLVQLFRESRDERRRNSRSNDSDNE
jgi:hypothetical protein